MTAYPDGRSIAYYPYEPKLTVFDSLGRPILHIKRDWEMRLVTNEEKQHWLERFRNSPNPAIQEHVRRVNFPRRHGAFIKAYPDDQGRIWLHTRDESDESGDSSATRRIIELYSSAGEWLGVQDISFRPLMIHRGAIYRTYLPEYGAARIERLKIIPLVPELTDSR